MNTSSIASMNAATGAAASRLIGDSQEERLARRLVARLSAGTEELPHDVVERLRVARMGAVARRRQTPRKAVVNDMADGTAILGNVWWTRLVAAVPLVALVVGLFVISAVQDDDRAAELADVDSALLVDDLPPRAYADPGFVQFLKNDLGNR
jgi:hypothetical protein